MKETAITQLLYRPWPSLVLEMDLAHTKSTEQVFEYFGVDESTGLSLNEVQLSQEKYGPNGEWEAICPSICLQSSVFPLALMMRKTT